MRLTAASPPSASVRRASPLISLASAFASSTWAPTTRTAAARTALSCASRPAGASAPGPCAVRGGPFGIQRSSSPWLGGRSGDGPDHTSARWATVEYARAMADANALQSPPDAGRAIVTAELLAVGTELTVGETTDTNSGELARSLVAHGVTVVPRSRTSPTTSASSWTRCAGRPRARRPRRHHRRPRADARRPDPRGGRGGLRRDAGRGRGDARVAARALGAPRASRSRRSTSSRRGSSRRRSMLPNPNGTAPGWWVERPDGRVVVALPGPAARDAADVGRRGAAEARRARRRACETESGRCASPGSASRRSRSGSASRCSGPPTRSSPPTRGRRRSTSGSPPAQRRRTAARPRRRGRGRRARRARRVRLGRRATRPGRGASAEALDGPRLDAGDGRERDGRRAGRAPAGVGRLRAAVAEVRARRPRDGRPGRRAATWRCRARPRGGGRRRRGRRPGVARGQRHRRAVVVVAPGRPARGAAARVPARGSRAAGPRGHRRRRGAARGAARTRRATRRRLAGAGSSGGRPGAARAGRRSRSRRARGGSARRRRTSRGACSRSGGCCRPSPRARPG